ncbi:unnamed protein product [Didymodactylos carnosus]|uniref:protein-tyrosine-phosphatase n=1 Tax=Didymodactylos carnosus TaxID=1234261 RepID=A0A813ZYM1_9BILA|nr:unnamed protein product [Didymodactylos carnosus]CAF3688662.1 unnamed protein product [Didymodactylos carnosus]
MSNSQQEHVSFWAKNFILFSLGSVALFACVTLFAVVYWCSKQRKSTLPSVKRGSSKKLSFKQIPTTSLPLSTTNKEGINGSTATRPKEIVLYPILPKLGQGTHVQPFSDNSSSASSNMAKKLLKKNLLERIKYIFIQKLPPHMISVKTNKHACLRMNTSGSYNYLMMTIELKQPLSNQPSRLYRRRRGSNNSLTISITPKRPYNSPPTDCPADEYLSTATRRLTLDEFHKHAQDARLLYHEFWTIPTNHLEKLRICGADEHSRVKLSELPGDPVSSYINANYVHGYDNEYRAFIATQGPMSNTIIDFWRMIWQENVPVIVMITKLYEKNKSKCERYLPDDRGSTYGPFHITVLSISHETDFEIRHLCIEFENQTREVQHLWFSGWPDHSTPDLPYSLIDLVKIVEASRLDSETSKAKGPVVVHCSAGIGRTGCFIALANGIKQLNKENVVDVVKILCQLRRDRGGMIQTNEQYQFLYQALSEYARTLGKASGSKKMSALQTTRRSLKKMRCLTAVNYSIINIDRLQASTTSSSAATSTNVVNAPVRAPSINYTGDSLPINMGLNEVKSLRLTDMKRGGGGRSSFSGICATIFGASGFVGKAALGQLAKEGSQIIVPYRDDPYNLRDLRLLGDLGQILFTPYYSKDENSIRKALMYSNVVINAIGRANETRNFSFDDIYVKIPRTIARLARECGVQRLIHISCLNASENPQPILFRNGSKSLKAKYYGEQAVREEFPEVTILRPSDIYGEGDNWVNYWLSPWTHSMFYYRFPLYGSGERTVKAPVHINDVARAIYAALRDPMSVGQTYEIYGPEHYKLRALLEFMLQYLRRPQSFITPLTPEVLLKAFANNFKHRSLYNIDKFQRMYTTDIITPGLPTIKDLGIEPIKFAKGVGPQMAYRRNKRRAMEEPSEFRVPPPPKPFVQEFDYSFQPST